MGVDRRALVGGAMESTGMPAQPENVKANAIMANTSRISGLWGWVGRLVNRFISPPPVAEQHILAFRFVGPGLLWNVDRRQALAAIR